MTWHKLKNKVNKQGLELRRLKRASSTISEMNEQVRPGTLAFPDSGKGDFSTVSIYTNTW